MAHVRVKGTEVRQSPVHLRSPSIALRFRWWLVWWTLTSLLRLVWWLLRHPRFTGPAGAALAAWHVWSTVGAWPLIALAAVVVVLLVVWAVRWRESFARLVGWRMRGCWRRWVEYRTRWHAAMVTTKLTERIDDRTYLPELVRVRSTGSVDLVTVRMLPGQVLTDWSQVSDRLAATFGALDCRVRTPEHRLPKGLRWLPWGNGRGQLVLWFLTHDPLTTVVQPAGPADPPPNLKALRVGHREDGVSYRLKLLGTHLLLVGATGAGKSSAIWTILAELAPGIRSGLVKVWALDPKGGMELAMGRRLFDRFCYGGDDTLDWEQAFASVLEDAVRIMRERQNRLRGFTRSLKPSIDEPFIVLIIDELVSLTGFVVDRDAKRRINSALGLLLAQGRAVGVCVIGATTDPRKELLAMRDGFPTRVCLRVTEPEHVKLVLADGARDRGARCDLIPESLPGVGFVGIDGIAEPLRVRFANWTDTGITELVERYAYEPTQTSAGCGSQASGGRRMKRERRQRGQVVPGQLELALDVPELSDDQRAEFAAHLVPGWQGMAACRSVADDTWFPEPGHTATATALVTCTGCPVRRSCLAYALAEDQDHGMWGGATSVQRDVIRQNLATGHAIPDLLDRPILRPTAQPLLMWQAVAS